MNESESDKLCANHLPWLLLEPKNRRELPGPKAFNHVVYSWNYMTGPGISILAKAKQRWPKADYEVAQQQKAAKLAVGAGGPPNGQY